MFGWRKKAKKVISEVKKMENRDAVEATVWGGYYIAFADGNYEPSEVNVLDKTIQSVPAFAPFAGEIAMMGANAKAQFEASPRRAGAEALRQLADVAGTPDAVDVLCLCIDIAEKGSEGIGKDEEDALKKIAAALQLNLDIYL
ncbi:tellurite resistance TerB family protein [Leclercia sp. Marseille-Q4284]|uniref:tellurite resistance TerB family protein n=1 Tax=Leclercia sp. Marseille-Q4284 TaxID=2866582 RepID=UPI001CE4B536|nr:tellurite resistance TerB family protein [Leclercia sp. Marseille-Q4284]